MSMLQHAHLAATEKIARKPVCVRTTRNATTKVENARVKTVG